MKAFKGRHFLMLAGLLASLALLAAGCLPSHGGGGVAEPAFCESNPEQCGPITVNLPAGYWSSGMHPLDARFVPMTLPDPAATSHFRVVAFDSVTGAKMSYGACDQGCVDIPAGTTSGTITVPLGDYNVCSLGIGPQSPTASDSLLYKAGGCAVEGVISVVSGTPATATITHTLGALAVASPAGPFAYSNTTVVTYTSTGLPFNLDEFYVFQVSTAYPSGSLNRLMCTAVAITGTNTNCTTEYTLGIQGATAATPFRFLATVLAEAYAVDWGSGLTLWTDVEDAGGMTPATSFGVLSAEVVVNPAETGSVNVGLQKDQSPEDQ